RCLWRRSAASGSTRGSARRRARPRPGGGRAPFSCGGSSRSRAAPLAPPRRLSQNAAAMLPLKDWTTYFFAGLLVAGVLGFLHYWQHFEIVNAQETQDKQYNEPEIVQGAWRLGRLPATGATIEPRMMAVCRIRLYQDPQV